jgi:hypothetical protein
MKIKLVWVIEKQEPTHDITYSKLSTHRYVQGVPRVGESVVIPLGVSWISEDGEMEPLDNPTESWVVKAVAHPTQAFNSDDICTEIRVITYSEWMKEKYP